MQVFPETRRLALRRFTMTGPGEAEVGYRRRRPAWGGGYATEGSWA